MRAFSQALFGVGGCAKSLFYKGFMREEVSRRRAGTRRTPRLRAGALPRCCDSRCEVAAKRVFRQRNGAFARLPDAGAGAARNAAELVRG